MRSPHKRDVVGASIGAPAGPLLIEHAITADMDDGRPLPPIDDNVWGLVRRCAGATTWRRICLTDEDLSPPTGARRKR